MTSVLGSINQLKKITGSANVYLAAYPSGGYTGATDALRVTNVKSLFFSDAATDADRVLIPSVYSDIDASGIEIDIKQTPVEFDPNSGPKYKAANGPTEVTVKWKFKDVDANKIMDAFSGLTGDLFTTTAATGVAGRKTVLLGRNSAPLYVAMLVRYPTSTISAGGVTEFQNVYVPFATITPDWQIKLDKKSVATVNLSASAIGDMTLIGSGAMPPTALIDDVQSAGL